MFSYPILAYKNDKPSMCYGFANHKQFSTTSLELLRDGIFKNVKVIDKEGRRYKIINAVKIRWANCLGGFSLTRKGRQIVVAFETSYIDMLDIRSMKELLLFSIGNSMQMDSKSEFMLDIKKSASIKDLIQLFL